MGLDKLTAAYIDSVVRSWEQTLQPSTLRATVGTVSAALEQACRSGLIPTNPAHLATKPRVPRRRATLPTLDQVVGLLDAAAADGYPTMAALLSLAAVTGLRRGELCGLQWRDLDEVNRALAIDRSLKRVTGRSIVGEPKTHRARRISINGTTVDMHKDFRART